MELLKIEEDTQTPLSFSTAIRYSSSSGWKTIIAIESSGEVLCTNIMPGLLGGCESTVLVKPSPDHTVDLVVGDWVEDRGIFTYLIAFKVAMKKAYNWFDAACAASASCFAAGYKVKNIDGRERNAFDYDERMLRKLVAPEVCKKISGLQKEASKSLRDSEFLELKIKLGEALGDLRKVEKITREFADADCLKRLLEKQAVRGLKALLDNDLDPWVCARNFRNITGIWYPDPNQRFRKNEIIRIYSLIRG